MVELIKGKRLQVIMGGSESGRAVQCRRFYKLGVAPVNTNTFHQQVTRTMPLLSASESVSEVNVRVAKRLAWCLLHDLNMVVAGMSNNDCWELIKRAQDFGYQVEITALGGVLPFTTSAK